MNNRTNHETTSYDEDLRTLAEYKRYDRQRENSLHKIMNELDDYNKNKRVSMKPIKWMQISFFTCAFAALSLLVFISLDDRDWDSYYLSKFSGEADISGVISNYDRDSISIYVASHPSKKSSEFDIEYYRILMIDGTIFFDENGKEMETGDFTSGDFVRVWVKGKFTSKYVSEEWIALEDEDIPTYTASAIQLREITLEDMYNSLLSNKKGKYNIHVFLRESVVKEAVQNKINPLIEKYRSYFDSIAYYYDHFEEYEAIALPAEITVIITDTESLKVFTTDLEEVEHFFEKLERIQE